MKKTIFALIVGLLITGMLAEARGPRGQGGPWNVSTPVVTPDPIVEPITGLTEFQMAKLLFIYQEEKVARDVYLTLGKLYDTRIFNNIASSEQKHIDAAQTLCEKYGVDISGVNEQDVGNFILPELQTMYDTLVLRGSESLLDALYVGELIEVTDIDDLENAMVDMPQDVVRIFSNLRDGSLNHLAAFQNQIDKQ